MSLRLLALILLLGMFGNKSLACSIRQPPPSDEERFTKASAVFVAHVWKTEEVLASFPGAQKAVPIVEGSFRVIETLKGQPPPDEKVRDFVFGPGNCSLGLIAGLDYLFFIYEDNFVLWPGGSQSFLNIEGTEPKRLLEKLRKLKSEKR